MLFDNLTFYLQMMRSPLLVLAIVALPGVLNDFLYRSFQGPIAFVGVDYATHFAALALVWFLSDPKVWLLEKLRRPSDLKIAAGLIICVIVIERLALLFSNVVMAMAGWDRGFDYPEIEPFALYIFDLTFGLALVAVSEEVIFRGLAWRNFRAAGFNAVATYIASAALFAAIHWSGGEQKLIYTGLTGLAMMALYRITGSLWPCILAHYLINFIEFV